MLTFKQFLAEMDDVLTDPEDLSPEELNQRALEMRKMAQLKAQGRGEVANKKNLRALQLKLRQATDPRQKADLQRRIKELTSPQQAAV